MDEGMNECVDEWPGTRISGSLGTPVHEFHLSLGRCGWSLCLAQGTPTGHCGSLRDRSRPSNQLGDITLGFGDSLLSDLQIGGSDFEDFEGCFHGDRKKSDISRVLRAC